MLRTVGRIGGRFSDSITAFSAVGRNANLRWLELAWAVSSVAYFGHLIAVSVYAYNVGGEKALGLIFLARLIPAALISPFAGMLGDRFRRERVLLLTNVSRVVLIAGSAAAVFLDADPWVVYGLSIAVAIATTPFRSAQAALTPSLAHTPEELTAANAVASGVESIAIFVGPALAGVLLGLASIEVVFAHHGAVDRRLGNLPRSRSESSRRNNRDGSWLRRRSPRRGSLASRLSDVILRCG